MDAHGLSRDEIRMALAAMGPPPAAPERGGGQLPPDDGVVTAPGGVAGPPITVVGEHEERTLDQLRRCAAYGSVAGAAICADRHLGYAQPVDGVLAYGEHVAVSGVGFGIACGNMAARTDLGLAGLGPRRLETLADDIARTRASASAG